MARYDRKDRTILCLLVDWNLDWARHAVDSLPVPDVIIDE